jgi:hypothetical protein
LLSSEINSEEREPRSSAYQLASILMPESSACVIVFLLSSMTRATLINFLFRALTEGWTCPFMAENRDRERVCALISASIPSRLP